MAISGSNTTLFAPRLPLLLSASTDAALQTHMKMVASDIAFRMPMSQFSFTTPNSNVSAQRGTWGVNLNSTASAVWFKQVGSGTTGWVALA
jgi:hypothetical protein